MFKNEYQGGAYVEIFSAQGKDPVAKWKLSGSQSAIFKDFDKEVKSFVFVLEGSSQTNKMQLPKENKQTLGLIQRFLVLQVHVPLGQDFSAELLITDLTNIKRRLYLSTVHKELSATPLHAKIPLIILKRKVWCNLCIDLASFTSGIFKGAIFQCLDGIIISANCKLRKIFTLKLRPQDTADEKEIYKPSLLTGEPSEAIPRTCQITTDVHQVTQVLDLEKLHHAEAREESKLLIAGENDQLTNSGQGSARNITQRNKSHIAFGSKVLGPPPCTSRKASSRPSAETSRSSYRQDRFLQQLSPEKGICTSNTRIGRTSSPKPTPPSDERGKENVQERLKQEPYPYDFNAHLLSRPPDAEERSTISGKESVGKDQTSVAVDGSSLGHCGNGDKRPVQIHMPCCERTNRAPTLNNSSVQSQPIALSDDWPCQEESKLYDNLQDTINTQSYEQVRERMQNEEPRKREDHLEEEDYVFTYSSVPWTIPVGKSRSYPINQGSPSFNEMQNNARGAEMEEDFYGSDSDREENSLFHRTSSPKLQAQSTSDSISEGRSPRKPKPSTARESITVNQKNITSVDDTQYLKGKSMGFDLTQKNLMPTRSLSPDGSRPDICKEQPRVSKTQQGLSVNKQRASMSKKSLKEIQQMNKGTKADGLGYNWTNYQSNRMSVSEMQMLASLKRQQNEELDDEGTIHGLRQSQIDHCNVDMSTSSDDTATWNCLPPPVSQGCHYENEMNPLNHSNPRDWLKAFSPPIIPISQEKNKDPLLRNRQSSGSASNEGDDGLGLEEEEEILTLLYDPCLNCYFDPETGKYYELA